MVEREECGGGEWWRERSVEVMSGEERGVWRW